MKTDIHYMVVFEKETDGRVMASVPGVPGCHAYGKTAPDALKKIKKILRFYISSLKKLGKRPPRQPSPVAVEIRLSA